MISLIADAHIKSNDHLNYKKVLQFLTHEKVQKSNEIYLLGDIFDGMLGVFDQYFTQYNEYFNALENLIKKGIKIYYLEGNHDIHLNILYQKFLRDRDLPIDSIIVKNDFIIREIDGLKYIFTHGDLIVKGKPIYMIYRYLINSMLARFIVKNIVGFHFFCFMVSILAKRSHAKKLVRFKTGMTEDEFRDYFRELSHKFIKRISGDILFAGHSHLKDECIFQDGTKYINPGSLGEDFCFVTFENGVVTYSVF